MYTLSLAVLHKHPAVMDLPVGQGAKENEPENQLGFLHQSEPKPEPVSEPALEPEDQLDSGVASMGSEPADFDQPMPLIHPLYSLLLACRADMEN